MSTLAFFLSLTKGTRQVLPFLQSAASSGLGANEILRQARAAGFSFRTQQALDVLGVLQNNVNLSRSIRTQPTNQPLDSSRFGTLIGNSLRNYRYTVLRRSTNKSTGETSNEYVSVSSNDVLSVEQIISKAEEFTSETSGRLTGDEVIESLTVTDAQKSAALGG